jgi:hypothetical protein
VTDAKDGRKTQIPRFSDNSDQATRPCRESAGIGILRAGLPFVFWCKRGRRPPPQMIERTLQEALRGEKP